MYFQPYQQQYFATSTAVLQTWHTGSPYYDISSVFQVNGLAPQTFKQPYRSTTRPRKQSKSSLGEQSSQTSSQGSNGSSSRQSLSSSNTAASPQNLSKINNASNIKPPPLMSNDVPRMNFVHHQEESHITNLPPLGKFPCHFCDVINTFWVKSHIISWLLIEN